MKQNTESLRLIKLFQIFDLVGQTVVGPIITAHHEAAAVRHFTDLLRDPKTMLGAHPDDYELRWLGYQNEQSGTIDPTDAIMPVLTGTHWKLANERSEGIQLEA